MTIEYRKYQLPYRRRLQARGLTVLGKPRRRKQRPELAGLDRKEYLRRYNSMRRRWRGVPLNRVRSLLLEAEIEDASAALAACYSDLPASAQARVIQLANHLAALRRKCR